MSYEFHVGDYVEREVADGTNLKTLVGYVNFYQPTLENCGVVHCFGFTWSNGTKDGGSYTECQFPMFFERIGRYDFAKMRYPNTSAKPEQPEEIERMKEMEEENIWNERSGGWLYAQQRKINELVDAVNELRKAK